MCSEWDIGKISIGSILQFLIHVLPMPDADNGDDSDLRCHFVHDPIVSDTDAIAMLISANRFASIRKRIFAKRIHSILDALQDGTRNPTDIFFG